MTKRPSISSLISRRRFLTGGLAAAATAVTFSIIPPALASNNPSYKVLGFDNTHTGEKLVAAYWSNGAYIPEALDEINHVLRDHRTGDSTHMDSQLLDILHALHRNLDSRTPFEVISGYRSPKSNAMLHSASTGVAENSQHLYGRAIDVRLGDVKLSTLRDAAVDLQAGGVGYYARSNFVHVDTGRVRRWG